MALLGGEKYGVRSRILCNRFSHAAQSVCSKDGYYEGEASSIDIS